MDSRQLKQELMRIFGNQIAFNKDFDSHAALIKNIDDTLLSWCQALKRGEIRALRAPKMEDCVIFIKKIGASNRCIVIKIVNGEFKEVHLGDHAYYDRLRKIIGLKKDSIIH
ncbi:hypothetical protein HZB03_04930 [Candidatus Woesearchaeota archaeon]|nr:hypothetical protein [Candidatus Woesearchaeota archaeon]